MREPKRLAHRQAERNKARALKRWSSDEDDDESSAPAAIQGQDERGTGFFLVRDAGAYPA